MPCLEAATIAAQNSFSLVDYVATVSAVTYIAKSVPDTNKGDHDVNALTKDVIDDCSLLGTNDEMITNVEPGTENEEANSDDLKGQAIISVTCISSCVDISETSERTIEKSSSFENASDSTKEIDGMSDCMESGLIENTSELIMEKSEFAESNKSHSDPSITETNKEIDNGAQSLITGSIDESSETEKDVSGNILETNKEIDNFAESKNSGSVDESSESGKDVASFTVAQPMFSCGSRCANTLSCSEHDCALDCHSGDCPPCALSVDAVKTCPCGKIDLEVLYEKLDEKIGGEESSSNDVDTSEDVDDEKEDKVSESAGFWDFTPKSSSKNTLVTEDKLQKSSFPAVRRSKCTDAIPICGEICGKKLSCQNEGASHACPVKCHNGECQPCGLKSIVRCR